MPSRLLCREMTAQQTRNVYGIAESAELGPEGVDLNRDDTTYIQGPSKGHASLSHVKISHGYIGWPDSEGEREGQLWELFFPYGETGWVGLRELKCLKLRLVLSQSSQRPRENDVHRRDTKDAEKELVFPGREITAREKPPALRAMVW
jgi:hypothetical protein